MTMHRSNLPGRLAMALAAVVLLAAFCVPVATSGLTCRDAPAAAARARDLEDAPESRGLNLELRILHLRIEFPWMKALPITPGRHIVISWLAGPED